MWKAWATEYVNEDIEGTKRGKESASQTAVGNTDQQMAHVSGNLFHTKELLWDTWQIS